MRAKARTQTSSLCTRSTETASALTVILSLLARLPGCPHPGACRVTRTETCTTHRQTNAAPGLVHPRRVSATTPRDAAGSGLTRCGERSSCQSSSAWGPKRLQGSSSARCRCEGSRGSSHHCSPPLLQSFPPLSVSQAGDKLCRLGYGLSSCMCS
ncbi:hypothetical protein NN561_006734 [Cricetulus griseus]